MSCGIVNCDEPPVVLLNDVMALVNLADSIPLQTDKARAELAKAEGKLDQYRKETVKTIDAADRKVEQKAAEAKSGISSWFGGK